MKQFSKIEGYPPELRGRFNSFIVTEFDDSMTIEMQMRVLIKWILKNIDLTNDMVEYLNKFIEMFDEKLYQTVSDVLDKWLADGIMSEIVNNIYALSGGINVKWYGAKGDGVTDDTEAFKQAELRLHDLDLNSTIFVPDGTYVITETIHFTKAVTIQGSPGSWIDYRGLGEAFLLGPNGLTVDTYKDHKMYNVVGLGFKNGKNATYAIRVNEFVTQPIIDGCRFLNYGNKVLNSNGYPNSTCIYFERDVWYGKVINSRCDIEKDAGALSFVSMARHGNARIVLESNLVHSLTGVGVAIYLNGVNCQVTNNKIEGFAINVMFGDLADYSMVTQNYFETAGSAKGGCISIGNYDESFSRSPIGINISDNYCNTHWQPTNPVSYFIAPTHEHNLINRMTVERNIVNAWHDSQVPSKMVYQNNLGGQFGNIANDNKWVNINDVSQRGSFVERWFGTDVDFNVHTIKQDANNTNFFMRKEGQQNVFGFMDKNFVPEFQIIGLDSGDIQLANKKGPFAKLFATGQTAFYKTSALGKFDVGELVHMFSPVLTEKYEANTAPNGCIYEDTTSGQLMYKNQQGIVSQLSNS